MDFFANVHGFAKKDPEPDLSFVSPETSCGGGIVPYFFVRSLPGADAPWERQLAWHATDALTPVFEDLAQVLGDDLEVCHHAAKLLAASMTQPSKKTIFALPTHPGHHATFDHYGGYCFVNTAVYIDALLREKFGLMPFVVDVDYHAGDGTASFLGDSGRFVSLHARDDYPFLGKHQMPWAVNVPPGATWKEYEPLLRAAMQRRPAVCNCLVVSLGFDTLDGDPDARQGHRLALSPADFGRMRRALRDEFDVHTIALQEGGYALESIPAAAEAFCMA